MHQVIGPLSFYDNLRGNPKIGLPLNLGLSEDGDGMFVITENITFIGDVTLVKDSNLLLGFIF